MSFFQFSESANSDDKRNVVSYGSANNKNIDLFSFLKQNNEFDSKGDDSKGLFGSLIPKWSSKEETTIDKIKKPSGKDFSSWLMKFDNTSEKNINKDINNTKLEDNNIVFGLNRNGLVCASPDIPRIGGNLFLESQKCDYFSFGKTNFEQAGDFSFNKTWAYPKKTYLAQKPEDFSIFVNNEFENNNLRGFDKKKKQTELEHINSQCVGVNNGEKDNEGKEVVSFNSGNSMHLKVNGSGGSQSKSRLSMKGFQPCRSFVGDANTNSPLKQPEPELLSKQKQSKNAKIQTQIEDQTKLKSINQSITKKQLLNNEDGRHEKLGNDVFNCVIPTLNTRINNPMNGMKTTQNYQKSCPYNQLLKTIKTSNQTDSQFYISQHQNQFKKNTQTKTKDSDETNNLIESNINFSFPTNKSKSTTKITQNPVRKIEEQQVTSFPIKFRKRKYKTELIRTLESFLFKLFTKESIIESDYNLNKQQEFVLQSILSRKFGIDFLKDEQNQKLGTNAEFSKTFQSSNCQKNGKNRQLIEKNTIANTCSNQIYSDSPKIETKVKFLNKILTSCSKKRPEECYKYFLIRIIEFLKTRIGVNQKASEEEFYAYYFEKIAKEHGIPIETFYYPFSKKADKDSKLNAKYFDRVVLSKQFVKDSEFYLDNFMNEEHQNEVDQKLFSFLKPYDQIIRKKKQSEEQAIIELVQYRKANKHCKFPWTNYELKECAERFKMTILKRL